MKKSRENLLSESTIFLYWLLKLLSFLRRIFRQVCCKATFLISKSQGLLLNNGHHYFAFIKINNSWKKQPKKFAQDEQMINKRPKEQPNKNQKYFMEKLNGKIFKYKNDTLCINNLPVWHEIQIRDNAYKHNFLIMHE